MNVIDMFEYERSSYYRKLKELYRTLDETTLSFEVGVEKRKRFFREMQGRFLKVSRLKRGVPIDQFMKFLKIPIDSFSDIENGSYHLTDREFFQFATFLGCAKEIPVFLEKLEKALTPGLREARKNMESTLETYGFRFVDIEDK